MISHRLLALNACFLGFACGQHVGAPTDDLDKISVDELFKVQVTSVGRKAQQLAKAPAAVFVLTAEDIRRSGATSIPEALQWVPGLTVLRVDGRSWVISARGSARLYADKILMMIDGRSLYMPLFSGVIWDAVDVPMETIERIEVVRGPGAVMWGPNAVNGVINIITRKAQDTKGATVSAAAGNQLAGAAGASWSARAGDRLAYRVWGKLDYRTPAFGSPGLYYFDSFTHQEPSLRDLDAVSGRLGFRFDGQPSGKDQWMVQGDIYRMGRHDPDAYPTLAPSVDLVPGHTRYDGGYVQARWVRATSSDNESAFQLSYSRDNINYPYVGGDLNNLNVDYQKRRRFGERNEFYWGAGYQQYWDSTYTNRFVGFDPRGYVYRSGDVVVRDEWQILPGRLLGSAGVRVDYISIHRFEYQPSLRLLYTPNTRQSLWAAVSRSVRVPSRVDRDLLYDNGQMLANGMPISSLISGSRSMRSEVVRSVEAGYRFQSGQKWSVDASAFWSSYRRLRETDAPLDPELVYSGVTPSLVLPFVMDNAGAGRSYGGELWGTWQVRPRWRLIPSYSYVKDSRWLPSSTDRYYQWDRLPADLRHQAILRSQHDLARNLQLDVMLRARSRDQNYPLPGVFLVDARLGWRLSRSGELSFSVSDLTNRQVLETYPEGPIPAIPLRRTFLIKWTQRI
jgi:iron complex outermembrane recepter protein